MIHHSFKFILFSFLISTASTSFADTIKKSNSGICHDKYSSYYDRTKDFQSFSTIKGCLDSGGRLPKNYKGNASTTSSSNKHSTTSKNYVTSTEYSRSQFGSGWADLNRDCQNSRMEALISQSVGQLQYKTSKQCKVKSGKWISLFSGKTIYNASDIDIDHVIPLKWAWIHGADKWSKDKRVKFANDPANLLSVEVSLNRQKGAKGLDEWLPPSNKCQYISRFLRVFKTYNLQLNRLESSQYATIKNRHCSS
ncbi:MULTISPECIES: HNH endonuclease family protein [unclassified Colwellia]|uniref:HNH endonuclease family protein n=1 Tax=unclassified Colwellia TaxID=196834 RepID=UPI001C70E50E|nr:MULTISPECIES: HNH endonuclease family protein [unclassified Colwellia]